AVQVRLVSIRGQHLPFAYRLDLGQRHPGMGRIGAGGRAAGAAPGVRPMRTGSGGPRREAPPARAEGRALPTWLRAAALALALVLAEIGRASCREGVAGRA